MARASATDVISHWSTLVRELQASPKDFYVAVKAAIQSVGRISFLFLSRPKRMRQAKNRWCGATR